MAERPTLITIPFPDDLRRATETHRAHPAGAHALRMYRTHRTPERS